MKRIKLADKYSTSIWKKEEKKFKDLEKEVRIPDEKLRNVDSVVVKRREDFEKIPKNCGCYWIWTNEPVYHRMHKKEIPSKVNKGEIIYNGITDTNLRTRIKEHLLTEEKAGRSGISLDIYYHRSKSHRKSALSSTKKVPYLIIPRRKGETSHEEIREKRLLYKLFLSKEEKSYIRRTNWKEYYFRNGINVSENKHKKYEFRVYFIAGLNCLYLQCTEKKWRERFNLPKLCTYSSGR